MKRKLEGDGVCGSWFDDSLFFGGMVEVRPAPTQITRTNSLSARVYRMCNSFSYSIP